MTHTPLEHDNRYSVSLEHKKHVLRFCGDWLGSFRNIPDATLRAVGHRAVLNGAQIITAIESK